jgi:hypothetical protein
MKNRWMWMLFWYVFTTTDQSQVMILLNQLGPAAKSAKVAEVKSGANVRYSVYYEAPSEIAVPAPVTVP